MNIFDRDLDVHARALTLRGQRMELLSTNIANADTPSFKARDIDFREAMAKAGSQPMRATQARHFEFEGSTAKGGAIEKYRVPFNNSFDGNTVELSVEQAKFGKAAGDFQATLNFLENRVTSIRKALKGE